MEIILLLLCVCLQVDKLLYERNVSVGAGQMALHLKVLIALTEGPDSAPRTYMQLATSYKSSSRTYDALF